ncbi:hypothetical protein HPB48_007275 [Haemaphysalis longicornis]|uniref:Repressor of the inhibitor of the protein kinase n=1 Tax=Haemaphysalis longicornis TaxID=44386 RepID=A0A9J6FA72_HAELO|nr:hypothetical protein HPB48_007275 [Haemaphysalis longicornis]
MRGQGYDGAAVMSGELRGVQEIIREQFPPALYTHCSSHSLNLCLSDASKDRDIQRAFGTVKEVCAFFRGSPQRTALLKRHLECALEIVLPLTTAIVKQRWAERHEAVSLFSEALPQIVAALEELIEPPAMQPALPPHLHSTTEYAPSTFSYVLLFVTPS